MKYLFLFEFMDTAWVPSSLRATIHDVLESCLGPAPRRYYEWVAREILNLVEDGSDTIVELGAGNAPITRELAKALSGRKGISLRVSDLYPNRALYQTLEHEYPTLIKADREPLGAVCFLPSCAARGSHAIAESSFGLSGRHFRAS
jgi:hypothetical protein